MPRRGSPTVVLVAGLKASAEDWSIAGKSAPTVFPEVAKFTRVCAYDRPGTPVGEKPSRSDPVPQPTTAADAVGDLHASLGAADETGPYVLVGHSYGGLVAKLYARTYPRRRIRSRARRRSHRRASGGGDAGAVGDTTELMEGKIRESLALYPALERNDPDRSFDQARAAPKLAPSADRLVRGPALGPPNPGADSSGALPADVPPDFGSITDAAQRQAQEKLATPAPDPGVGVF